MPLSREIDIKLCQNDTKTYIYVRFCKRFLALNRSYSANTQPIKNYDIPEEPDKLKFAPIII